MDKSKILYVRMSPELHSNLISDAKNKAVGISTLARMIIKEHYANQARAAGQALSPEQAQPQEA